MPSENTEAAAKRRHAPPESGRHAPPETDRHAPPETDPESRPPDAEETRSRDVVIVIHVVRTGGFAGLKREWTAEPSPTEAPHWVELIEDCPWDAAASAGPPRGADRFAWRISARRADDPPRRAELSDDELQGPWRELVDEVRSFVVPPARPAR